MAPPSEPAAERQFGARRARVFGAAREAMLDAWAVVMPVDCAGCGLPDRGLCPRCRAALVPMLFHQQLEDGTPVVSAVVYDRVARRTILAFKEQGRTDAAGALAGSLRSAVVAACSSVGTSSCELVTIPPSRASYRRRGYNPVGLLLRRAGFASAGRLLAYTRGTAQQKILDHDSRVRNLVSAFAAVTPLTGRRFVVVDDIITTGATLTEAVRALRVAGAEVVAAATLAHTPRYFPTRHPAFVTNS